MYFLVAVKIGLSCSGMGAGRVYKFMVLRRIFGLKRGGGD
jgi:hypothetical protein